MFETVASRLHTLEIGEPVPGEPLYDLKRGWELVRAVEVYLLMLRKFQGLVRETVAVLASGTPDEKEAVRAR